MLSSLAGSLAAAKPKASSLALVQRDGHCKSNQLLTVDKPQSQTDPPTLLLAIGLPRHCMSLDGIFISASRCSQTSSTS